MTALLRRFAARLDRPGQPCFGYDEITVLDPWPDGALEFFLDLGLLIEAESADSVWLWECHEPDWADPAWLPDAASGRVTGFYHCGHGCGIHEVRTERRRQWMLSYHGLIAVVAQAIGSGDSAEVVPGRVSKVGSMLQDGRYRELFLVRGGCWSDARQVLAAAERLRASPAPAVFVLDRLPPEGVWSGLRPPVLPLSEIAIIREGGLVLDLAPLLAQPTVPHAGAAIVEPLSVTEAAEFLMKDLPGLTLERARARVSAAASRGAFKTNGKKKTERRIDRDSFASWRLKQRDKDLDAEDADDD